MSADTGPQSAPGPYLVGLHDVLARHYPVWGVTGLRAAGSGLNFLV